MNEPNDKENTQDSSCEEVGCKSGLAEKIPAERDQLAEIAMMTDKYFIHEKTDNSLTVESVEALIRGVSEAWRIINVLNMSEMDNGDAYPRALEWLEKWGDLQPDNL